MAEYIRKKTQGEIKMERYIEDLIRNKEFLKKIKRLRRSNKFPKGMYDTWTSEEKAKDEAFSKELMEIMTLYKDLRKRCGRVFNDPYWRTKSTISEVYNLDSDQIGYIEYLLKPNNKDYINEAKSRAELDMCKMYDLYDEELNHSEISQEIIHLNRSRQLLFRAYPLGILVHPKASKRDVLDFVEKKWNWIENNFLRSYAEKKLKYGKRKYQQELLDYLWANRFLSSEQLKLKIDELFPKNGLVYYEITNILKAEKEKRLSSSS